MPHSALLVSVIIRPEQLGKEWKTPTSITSPIVRDKFADPLSHLLFGEPHRKAKQLPDPAPSLTNLKMTGLELLYTASPTGEGGKAVPAVLIVRIEHVDATDANEIAEILHKIVRGEWRTKMVKVILRYANSGESGEAQIRIDNHAPSALTYPIMYLGVSDKPIDQDGHLALRRVATATPDRLYGANRDLNRRRDDAWNERYRVNDSLFASVTGYGVAFKAMAYDGEDDPEDLVAYQYTEIAAYIRLEAALLAHSSTAFADISAEVRTADSLKIRRTSLRLAEELRMLLIREVQYRNAATAQPIVFQRFLVELEKQFRIVQARDALRADAESLTNVLRLVEDAREAAFRKQASLLANIFAAFIAVLSLAQVPPAVAQMSGALWKASASEQASIQAWTLACLGGVVLFLAAWWTWGTIRRKGPK